MTIAVRGGCCNPAGLVTCSWESHRFFENHSLSVGGLFSLLRSASGMAVSANPAINEVVQEWMVALLMYMKAAQSDRPLLPWISMDCPSLGCHLSKHNKVIMIKLTDDE